MQRRITRHAYARMRQRGIRESHLLALSEFADIETMVARGLHVLRLSKDAIREVAAQGLRQADVDRLRSLALVEAHDGSVVTLAHVHGRKSRAYTRRDRRKFWR